jgi:hypothetical protein
MHILANVVQVMSIKALQSSTSSHVTIANNYSTTYFNVQQVTNRKQHNIYGIQNSRNHTIFVMQEKPQQ